MKRTFVFNYEIPLPHNMIIKRTHPAEVESYVDKEYQKEFKKSIEENNIEENSVNIIHVAHYQKRNEETIDISIMIKTELIANVKPDLNEIETFIENLETLKIN